ncbi:Yip1 family protein [Filibacter tadaridae]|uniref:Yip1 domain protein n=1 Tax=Filibacter tadaridae TaxID=2483811 RepID=A0A3P5XU58_9BACL|nr:Yip1 family protein [Filibacter tadaridae]VDC32574.1 Yip1 domain protein [Filibacter tadaridae]
MEGNRIEEKQLNPWLTIWVRPRETVRYAINTKPMKFAVILALLAGIPQMLDGATSNNLGDSISLPTIFILALIMGPLLGLLSWWIGSGISYIVGTWIGGSGGFDELKMATAISKIPYLLVSLIWLVDIAILGGGMFTEEYDFSRTQIIWLFISGFVAIVTGIWTFVITIFAIAEAHRFSAWKSLLTMFIPFVAIVLVLSVFIVPFIFM